MVSPASYIVIICFRTSTNKQREQNIWAIHERYNRYGREGPALLMGAQRVMYVGGRCSAFAFAISSCIPVITLDYSWHNTRCMYGETWVSEGHVGECQMRQYLSL